MILYRLARTAFANDLSGRGAEKYGGRWNSPDTCMLYTASNPSLAMLEVFVHLNLDLVPTDYRMVCIFVPDDIPFMAVSTEELAGEWFSFPMKKTTQTIGDHFIRTNKYFLCKVPSSVTRGDFNFLINPGHHHMKNLKIVSNEAFPFDDRLLMQLGKPEALSAK